MTRQKAVMAALKLINECDKHSEENGSCRECPLALNGNQCLVSGGNDIPHLWLLKEKLQKLLEE